MANRLPELQAPYMRWPDESGPAYAAFQAYMNMHFSERTLTEAYRRARNRPHVNTASGTWSMWFQKYHWAERASAWDAELARVEREAMLREAALRAQRWADRRLQLIEQEWEDAQRMREMGLQMLNHSITQTVETTEELTDNGLQVINQVKPVGWRMRDAALFLTKASDIGRRAANMATDLVAEAPAVPDVEADPLSKAQAVARNMVERFPQYTLDQILQIASQVSGFAIEVLRPGVADKAGAECSESEDSQTTLDS